MKHLISQALHAKEQQGWEGASRCNPAQPISVPSSTALLSCFPFLLSYEMVSTIYMQTSVKVMQR